MSKPFTNRWGLIVGGAAVIAVGAFVYLKFGTASKEKEFSLIKPWFEPQGALANFLKVLRGRYVTCNLGSNHINPPFLRSR
ncbi:MAG: hypothetical protein WCL28_09780, partial [bacterium]